MRIRRGILADLDVITDFNCRLAWETENKRLDVRTVRRGVERGLELTNDVQYWVAETDEVASEQSATGPAAATVTNAVTSSGSVVGQLMLTREWSDWRNGWMMWLQSVYVDAAYRGQGVFRKLLDHVVAEMQADPDVVGLRLYVEHENQRAIQVYQRQLFADAGYVVMEQMFQPKP